jgi:O-Antigen ligase
LLFLMFISFAFYKSFKLKIPHTSVLYYSLFITTSFLSTITSSAGFERSSLTFAAELAGVLFSVSLIWWLCQEGGYAAEFFKGYKMGGWMSSIYSLYQLFGLSSSLPFSYIPVNNGSFSLLDLDATTHHNRAIALTPEPSILASLLMPLIGISLIDFLYNINYKNTLKLCLSIAAFLSTSSQSITILPIYIVIIFAFMKYFKKTKTKANSVKIFFILLLISCMVFTLISSNESIVGSLGRVLDFENNGSAKERGGDVTLAFSMFLERPLMGWGLAAIGAKVGNFQEASSAASTFFRSLTEQGLLGMSPVFLSLFYFLESIVTFHKRQYDLAESELKLFTYYFSLIISLSTSAVFFVGYRNLYHMWLMPVMIIGMREIVIKSDEPISRKYKSLVKRK